MSLAARRRGVAPRIVVLGIVALAAAAGCIRLGIWQLDRLEGRRARNALVLGRTQSPVLALSALQGQDTAVTHWRRVRVRGVADYDAEVLHATRSQNGSPGVHLLTPLRPLDGAWGDTAVLLLRGFVMSPDGRTIDRAVARDGDTIDVEALVTIFPPRQPGNARMPSAAGAVRFLDRDTISTMMRRPLAPFVLLALGDTVVRDVTRPARVPPPSQGEGPHFSYAMQWFGFALVAAVGFVAFARTGSLRRRKDEGGKEL